MILLTSHLFNLTHGWKLGSSNNLEFTNDRDRSGIPDSLQHESICVQTTTKRSNKCSLLGTRKFVFLSLKRRKEQIGNQLLLVSYLFNKTCKVTFCEICVVFSQTLSLQCITDINIHKIKLSLLNSKYMWIITKILKTIILTTPWISVKTVEPW